jgi:hypothetical protein
VLGLDFADDYDFTCYDVYEWPEPEDGTYEYLYVEINWLADEENDIPAGIAFVPDHQLYTIFQEGDIKRALMDFDDPIRDLKTRRANYAYSGAYCIYWDNWDGYNPQPWSVGDCAVSALFLNDEYYECYYDDTLSYCDSLEDYAVQGCDDYDYVNYECLEWACIYGTWAEVPVVMYEGTDDEYTYYNEVYTCANFYGDLSYYCDDVNDSDDTVCDCYDLENPDDDSSACLDPVCSTDTFDFWGNCVVECTTFLNADGTCEADCPS